MSAHRQEAPTASPSPAPQPRVEVTPVATCHAGAVAAFFREVWNPSATAEAVEAGRTARDNPAAEPDGIPAFAFMLDDRVVGYIGTIPAHFHGSAGITAGHWLKGFMVLPEHRNGPIGYFVLKEATRRLATAAALTVADPSRRLFEALGYRNLGRLSNQILPLRPANILQLLDPEALGLGRVVSWVPRLVRSAQRIRLTLVAGGALAAALAGWFGILRLRLRRFTFQPGLQHASDAEIDALAAQMHNDVAACAVRDAAYLRWRYPVPPAGPYAAVLVREQGQLVGIAIVRIPRAHGDSRLKGIRVATLSDACFAPGRPEAGRAVVSAAARAARQLGADALLGSASHPALKDALRQCGALPFPATVHFLVRDPGGRAGLAESLDGWWITRGDASSDEVF